MAKRLAITLDSALYETLRAYSLSCEYTEPATAARDLLRQALASEPGGGVTQAARSDALREVRAWALARLRAFFGELEDELARTSGSIA